MNKAALLTLLFLVSCSVGPKYTPPVLETPCKFINQENEKQTAALQEWWKQFGDDTLSQLIQDGTSDNFDMRVSLERLYKARAFYVQNRGDFFPTVDAIGRWTRERFSQELFDSPFLGPPLQDFYQLGFDASWELDFFGKVKSGVQAAKAEIGVAQEDLRDTYITVTSEIARNYFELRAEQHRVSNFQKRIALIKEQAALKEAQYASGYIDLIDVKASLAELASLRSALPTHIRAVNQTLYALAVLVGKRPDQMVYLLSSVTPLPRVSDPIPQLLPAELLKRRPDIRKAERQLAAATARIGEAVADLFPRVSLTGSFRQESSETGTLFNRQARAWDIGPSVRWPILTFGRVRANIEVKSHEQKEALDLYEKTVYSALKDVESALTGFQTAEDSSSFQAAATRETNMELSLMYAQYDAGYIDYIEVINKRVEALQEEDTLFQTLQEKLTNLVSLYKALGGEWECSTMP